MAGFFNRLAASPVQLAEEDADEGRITMETLVSLLKDWLDVLADSLKKAKKQPDAPIEVWEWRVCEDTRMILGILSILAAYYPEEWPVELGTRALSLLDEACSLAKDYPDNDPEKRHLFRRNIGERRDNLRHLMKRWSPESAVSQQKLTA